MIFKITIFLKEYEEQRVYINVDDIEQANDIANELKESLISSETEVIGIEVEPFIGEKIGDSYEIADTTTN